MIFEQIPIGGDKNFAYLFGDRSALAVVDPGCGPAPFLARAAAHDAPIRWALATHSHGDHIAGVNPLRQATGATYAAHPRIPGIDQPLPDNATFHVGAVPVVIRHCPGHSPDSILIIIANAKVLVGDELFIGGVGKTHSAAQALQHYHSLHDILLTLPDHLEVYPGHHYGAEPFSTIAAQRQSNPYLLQSSPEAFWELRQHWKDYCRTHGIAWG